MDTHGYKSCFSCDLDINREQKKIIENPDDDTMILHGITFHVTDFVFICPSDDSKILEIGQIIRILGDQIEVAFLERYDDYVYYQKEHEAPNHEDLKYDEVRSIL